jgi:hypothetical protein
MIFPVHLLFLGDQSETFYTQARQQALNGTEYQGHTLLPYT